MEQALTEAFYFYIAAVAVGTFVGAVSTILYAGLYHLRQNN